jgi:hypothetical protein
MAEDFSDLRRALQTDEAVGIADSSSVSTGLATDAAWANFRERRRARAVRRRVLVVSTCGVALVAAAGALLLQPSSSPPERVATLKFSDPTSSPQPIELAQRTDSGYAAEGPGLVRTYKWPAEDDNTALLAQSEIQGGSIRTSVYAASGPDIHGKVALDRGTLIRRSQSLLESNDEPSGSIEDFLGQQAGTDCDLGHDGCVLEGFVRLRSNVGGTAAVSDTAVWRTIGQLENLDVLGFTTDRVGRRAVGLTTTIPGQSKRIVILADPQTGRLLGAETEDRHSTVIRVVVIY